MLAMRASMVGNIPPVVQASFLTMTAETTPSWIDNSGTVGNRMVTDSTGTLTWAPANMLLQSQTFNTTWTPFGLQAFGSGSIVDATTAPDGTLTADKIVESNASGAHYVGYVPASTSGSSCILSVYAKKSERSSIALFVGTVNVGKYFDLNTGTIGGNAIGAPLDASIEDAGNGWYRCSITFTSAAGADARLMISNPTTSYVGDGVSGLFIWGAQWELVTYQRRPRAYIPTTDAARFLPRYDFDAATTPASPRGMLIEETRTNLVTYSQEFDNAAWTKTRLNTTGTPAWVNVATAPDGTMTADKLIEDTTAANSHLIGGGVVSFTTGAAYTISLYVKAAERSNLRITFPATAFTSTLNCYINASNGTTFSLSPGVTATATNVGNGWYRFTATATATANVSATATQIFMVNGSGTSTNSTYDGDGVSGLFIWGAQLELGAFATSYIPTTTGSVQRVADNVNGLTASISYNAARGTFGVQFLTGYSGLADTPRYMLALDSNSNKRIAFLQTGADTARTFDGTTTVTSTGDVTGAASRVFMAFDEAATARSIVSNGGTVATGTVAAGFGTASTINIGRLGSNQLCGWVQSFAYYNTRLPDATLKQKSAVGAAY